MSTAASPGTPAPTVTPAPFVSRPFAGLAGETDWVALREIVPAATAPIRLDPQTPALAGVIGPDPGAAQLDLTVATLLPMAVAGVHRADGARLLALQSIPSSGDASRDVAAVILALLGLPSGEAVATGPAATVATPRLQDLLDLGVPFAVTVHDRFDYWLSGNGGTEQVRAAVDEASQAISPTTKLAGVESAYCTRVGERVYLRWFLPYDEDQATDALARLHVTRSDTLGGQTRLLGAFRACGLLVPVWELDPALEPARYQQPLADLAERLEQASGAGPLDAQQRRARAGLLSRQVTLR
ncbi:MAG TPA: DUF5926 family protein [Dermatophilaceae bacterium]|nr:DUF5926 family protein [Dermatophilaceae bacterium]